MNLRLRFKQLMRIGTPLSILLIALTLSQTGNAQVLYGSITGNVTDSSGAVVSGATVTITHKETGQSRESVTDAQGSYDFPTVQAGTYTIKVGKSGFKSLTRENITVTLNNVTRADLSVEVGQVNETVIITAEAAQLKADRADVSVELTSRPLQSLPVPLGRNYQNLFKTLPGITPPENAHSIPSNPSRSLVFNVNGASRSSNNTRIDGVSSTNVWLPHVTAYIPSLEAIETVNVVTNSFDAEQGLAGGAAINVQIKSGTNNFHGSAFEYHANHKLNAKDFFTPQGQGKNKFLQNQYGGTFGGPIKKDKLFFFASYEGTKNRQNDARTESVPTLALRNGDFSNARTTAGVLAPIFDPASSSDPRTRTQFADNKIPAGRIDPIALKILDLVPKPNLPGETNNYYVTAPFLFDRWTVDSKVNWTVNTKLNMFGRYSILDFNTFNETVFGKALQGRAINSSNPGSGGGKTHSISAGGVYTLSQNFIVDANFGFVRQNSAVAQSDIAENRGLDFLGIPGTNGSKPFEGGFPFFDFPDNTYSDYGTVDTFMPYTRSDDQFQYVVNANWLKGAHNIRFGSDIYFQKLNHTQPEFLGGGSLGARGGFRFEPGVTQRQGDAAIAGAGQFNNFAAFLLGAPQRIGKLNQTVDVYNTRNRQYSLYVRDQWQVNQKFTFSYGTRWEYFPIPTRADRGLERYNPDTNKMEIGGVGSVPEDLGVKISKRLFAPRFGLAYRLTPTFVIRAGYGITNDPYALARPLRTNHPILINFNQSGVNAFTPTITSFKTGIPAVAVPDLGNGIIDVPAGVAANTLPEDFDRGYVQSWNLTLQKELGLGFVGEAGYVATRQIRQLGLLEQNWSPLGGARNGRQLFAKFGRTASTLLIAPVDGSRYDSLQTRLTRRFADGGTLHVNYTWSKSIGVAGNDNSDDQPRIKDPQFYFLNRALSGFDRTHNFSLSSVMELPFGKGRRWLNGNGALSAIVGGWQINNIITLMSGTPFRVTDSNTSLNNDGTSDQRPDLVKSKVETLGGKGRGQKWFDTSAFAPIPNNANRFGTAGWNLLRGPGIRTWDLGLFRRFQLTERFDLQFRAEAFNFTNTPIFDNPQVSITSGDFGSVTSTAPNAPAANRQFRFGLRLGF
ncbi:MAG: TonB-dependent receptor domain-containing protein [Blastocatellia bacterium]